MSTPEVAQALAAGFAQGLERRLRVERPDLAWEVRVGPVDRAKLARLEPGGDVRPNEKPAGLRAGGRGEPVPENRIRGVSSEIDHAAANATPSPESSGEEG